MSDQLIVLQLAYAIIDCFCIALPALTMAGWACLLLCTFAQYKGNSEVHSALEESSAAVIDMYPETTTKDHEDAEETAASAAPMSRRRKWITRKARRSRMFRFLFNGKSKDSPKSEENVESQITSPPAQSSQLPRPKPQKITPGDTQATISRTMGPRTVNRHQGPLDWYGL